MVEREQGIVRNATLAGVEHLKLDIGLVHADVKENLAVTERIEADTKTTVAGTERIETDTKTIVAGTGQIHKYLESEIVLRLYPLISS